MNGTTIPENKHVKCIYIYIYVKTRSNTRFGPGTCWFVCCFLCTKNLDLPKLLLLHFPSILNSPQTPGSRLSASVCVAKGKAASHSWVAEAKAEGSQRSWGTSRQSYLQDHPGTCKSLATMDSKSPRPGVVGPLPNGLFRAYKWGLLTTY